MYRSRMLTRIALGLGVIAAVIAHAEATTLVRMSLSDLVTTNATVLVGKVLDVHSRWNSDGTFILSDVRFVTSDVLKGDPGQREFSFTVMGGTVGDLATVIVAGPEIEIGREYVLFLSATDLPGANGVTAVRDLCQGIFDVVASASGPRAVSQASRHPLLPDITGSNEAPGGTAGIALDDLNRQIRLIAGAR